MERWIMVADLARVPSLPVFLPGFATVVWSREGLRALGEVLYEAYHETPEAEIYEDLNSMIHCIRLLQQMNRSDALIAKASGGLMSEDSMVGVVIATRTIPGTASIEHIGVLPAYRRRGLGKALLDWSMLQLAQIGFQRLELHVTASNTGAMALYRRAGFTQLSVYEARQGNP